MAWPVSGTNEVTATIGATGRDHSTISAWESDTDYDLTVATGTDESPVGICYDDADFTETQVYLYGATSDSTNYRTLTAASGERHDGTYLSGGVELTGSSGLFMRDKFLVVEWLILYCHTGPLYSATAGSMHMVRYAVFPSAGGDFNAGSTGTCYLRNSVAIASAGLNGKLIGVDYMENCSVLGGAYPVKYCNCVNVISVGASTECFYSCTGENNISGDTTDAGADTINSVSAADIYSDTGSGTEDLHLKDDSTDASGAGEDLSGATYAFTTDIDGDTRSDWDIGADEWVGAPPAGVRTKRLTLLGAA